MKGLIMNVSGRKAGRELTVHDVPRDPSSKEFLDFRDRAAYVYLTGTFPTHIRKYFTGLLRAVTDYTRGPASVDGRFGHIQVNDDVVKLLRLEEHPMVRRVKAMIEEGYVIDQPVSPKERRPYGRVPLVNTSSGEKATVQSDGSIVTA